MKKILSAILCSVLIFTLSGCEKSEVKNDNDSKVVIKETVKDEVKEETKEETKDEITDEAIKSKEVVLYFSDDQAMYLVGQKRNIEELTAKAIILELIKGPSRLEGEEELYETLPSELKLLDVQVKEGIASVDFSGDSIEAISGGSTGEGMALYSIINTLISENNLGITKVQFLVDGKKVDSIKGHYDVSVPMIEDKDMIKK
ncbi:MAG: GerMN domain-containing protein [Clostridium sp.]